MIIAVDGPSAAGKGTLARAIARQLGYHFLDTGSLYRRVGFAMLRAGKPASDEAAAIGFAQALDLALPDAALRSETVAAMTSEIAQIPGVRAALVQFQRDFAGQTPGAVLDGRDIGTAICPEAEVKLFVTAAPEVRARRRFAELTATGHDVQYTDVLAEIAARDARDAKQTLIAADAVVIDTTNLDPAQALDAALAVIHRKG